MEGKLIMLRSTSNQPVIRRLCEQYDGSATICREDVFAEWQRLGTIPVGVKVKREDVFEYDPVLFELMKVYDEALDNNPTELVQLWKRAKPL